MKRILLMTGAAGLALTAATFAHAAQSTASVTKIDSASRTVTLSDGNIYDFTPSIDLSTVKIGDRVTVMYSTDDGTGQNNATAIVPAT